MKIPTNIRLKKGFVATLGLAAALSFSAGFAQSGTDEEVVEEVIVTGSRIARPDFTQTSPTVSIGKTEINNLAAPDLATALAELPSIGATGTLAGNSGSNALAGVSSLDLRRLGLTRTLTLVDGRRHVAAVSGSSQVDISTIPSALVERVDVVTGGASAIYGSDAVSGVVNVILKENFEGIQVDVDFNNSTESVGDENYGASIIGGLNFAQGKGNAVFYAGGSRVGGLKVNEFRQFDNWGTIINPANRGENDGVPDRLRVPRVLSELISSNTVINPFGGGPLITFTNDGTPIAQTRRENSNSFAFGNFPNGCEFCFNTEDSQSYFPEVDRYYAGFKGDYDITDNLNVYASAKYVNAEILQLFQPSFRFGNVFINVQDNAFLDETLRQQLLAGGQRFVRIAKFFDELGFRSADNERELTQYVVGLKGDFSVGASEFNWDVSYVSGESENERLTLNSLIVDNVRAAFDSIIDPATGQAVCRSLTAGSVNPQNCVAYNPFGLGQSSQAARDFISADVTREDTIDQEVVSAILTSDTSAFLNLPGGAIDYVFGFEYREESSRTTTDALTQSGVLANAATPDSFGEFDVTEFFTEVSVPLLKDVFLFQELTLGAAYRTADYSHAGSANAWKVDLNWIPIESLRLRGTIGEAVRAPNINEAFSPRSPGFSNISDPCDADNINDNPNRAANCAALGIPAGFQANDNVSINTISGGNPNLTSEESESYTLGFVWSPSSINGFDMSVDYYNIEISDAILFVDPQDILNNCVDSVGGLDNAFCSSITRNGTTNDVETVESGFINASSFSTSGVELNLRHAGYDLSTVGLPGEVSAQLRMNYLRKLDRREFQNLPDDVNVEDGEIGDPDFQFTLNIGYRLDKLQLGWRVRHIARSSLIDLSPNSGSSSEDFDITEVAAQTTHDLTFGYSITDDVDVYGGLRNIFDDTPPGFVSNALYDIIGRRVFLGLNARF